MPGSTGRADGFDVVPAALRGAAGTFASEADALDDANAALLRHLSTLGAPWGHDQIGTRFGAAYQPAADAVSTNVISLATGLARISAALVATADQYERADVTVGSAAGSATG